MNGLAGMLAALVERAETESETPQRITLPRRLRVDIKIKRGQLLLQLSRAGVYPSEQEWKSVLAALHYPVNNPFSKMEYGGRCFLRGTFDYVRAKQASLNFD